MLIRSILSLAVLLCLTVVGQGPAQPQVRKANSGYTRPPAPSDSVLNDSASLIIVHASTQWDEEKLTKPALDRATEIFKQHGQTVVYLEHKPRPQATGTNDEYFLADKKPTLCIASNHGEHDMTVNSQTLVVGGGQFHRCLRITLNQTVSKWLQKKIKDEKKDDLHLIILASGSFFPASDVPLIMGNYLSPKNAATLMQMEKDGKETFTLADYLDLETDPELRRNHFKWLIGNQMFAFQRIQVNVDLKLGDDPTEHFHRDKDKYNWLEDGSKEGFPKIVVEVINDTKLDRLDQVLKSIPKNK